MCTRVCFVLHACALQVGMMARKNKEQQIRLQLLSSRIVQMKRRIRELSAPNGGGLSSGGAFADETLPPQTASSARVDESLDNSLYLSSADPNDTTKAAQSVSDELDE